MEKQLTPIAEAIKKTISKIDALEINARKCEAERDYMGRTHRHKEIQVLRENIVMLKSLLPKERESHVKFMVESIKKGLEEEGSKSTEQDEEIILEIANKSFNETFKTEI